MTQREKELFDERAGILEYDAGMTREEAEKQAEIEINNERNENE